MMAHRKALAGLPPIARQATALLAAAAALAALPAQAQNLTITPQQRATAQKVAQAGVPLSELAPNAPDSYTVKKGDTLWAISTMYLTTPWRWPELWGMNMEEVRNPHRIYPGQKLVLEKVNGLARLRVEGEPAPDTVRVSPRIRYQAIGDGSIPTLAPGVIEPFLAEPVIVGEGALQLAPRIVATTDERVLLTRGDRLYARSSDGNAMSDSGSTAGNQFRVFRNAVPLRDPYTHALLGYEAQYLGRVALVRAEGSETVGAHATPVPATLDVVSARSEMSVGDRLLPEPERQPASYAPHAPSQQVEASIVSVYGDAVGLVGHNQIVVISKGTADGMEVGHVLAVQRAGANIVDRSQPGERTEIKLPNERNGLLMVFRPFERLSYALVLESTKEVQIGDRVVNPR